MSPSSHVSNRPKESGHNLNVAELSEVLVKGERLLDAEAFDDDPFGMLAWRGRGREKLLASLRRISAGQPEPPGPVINVTGRPLAECLDDFWSPGLSPARLRAMPTAPVTAPDLLLRSFEPPAIAVRGRDLADVLAPIYQRLAGHDG